MSWNSFSRADTTTADRGPLFARRAQTSVAKMSGEAHPLMSGPRGRGEWAGGVRGEGARLGQGICHHGSSAANKPNSTEITNGGRCGNSTGRGRGPCRPAPPRPAPPRPAPCAVPHSAEEGEGEREGEGKDRAPRPSLFKFMAQGRQPGPGTQRHLTPSCRSGGSECPSFAFAMGCSRAVRRALLSAPVQEDEEVVSF